MSLLYSSSAVGATYTSQGYRPWEMYQPAMRLEISHTHRLPAMENRDVIGARVKACGNETIHPLTRRPDSGYLVRLYDIAPALFSRLEK